MNALLTITTNEQGSDVVSARELYEFLGFDRSQWSRWCKKNIVSNPYALEDADWKGFDIMSNGNASRDYALTVDFAERLSMLARTEKGEEIRRWFQSIKNKALEFAPVAPAPTQLSRKELALMVVQIEEEKEALEKQLAIAQPKVAYVDEVLDTTDCVVTTVIASELGYSAVSFNKLLKERGIQWKVNGVWVLTSKYYGKGYAQMRTHVYHDSTGQRHTTLNMVWTQRGRALLHYLFRQQNQPQPVAN